MVVAELLYQDSQADLLTFILVQQILGHSFCLLCPLATLACLPSLRREVSPACSQQ